MLAWVTPIAISSQLTAACDRYNLRKRQRALRAGPRESVVDAGHAGRGGRLREPSRIGVDLQELAAGERKRLVKCVPLRAMNNETVLHSAGVRQLSARLGIDPGDAG